MTSDRVGGDEAPHLGWAGFWRILLLVGLATLLFPGLAGGPRSVAAQERSVEWSRFDVTVDLQTDGSYHVTERQVVDFQGGPFSGGFRDVPLGRIDDINNVTVSEETASGVEPYTFDTAGAYDETSRTYTYKKTSSQLHIEWGFPRTVSEVRTFLVEYDVIGAMRVYLTNDPPNEQIWWTAVGTELTDIAPVREATLRMRLPIALPIDQTLTSGGDPSEHTKDGRVWTWTAENLTEGESFEARLQFPPLIAANPPRWQQADDTRRQNEEKRAENGAFLNIVFIGLGLVLAVGGGLGTYGLWYSRGRDPHTGAVADFIPNPPDDLPPGAAGTLLDERADQRDIVATLVDLGHRGVIKIDEQVQEGVFGFGGGRDYELTLLKADAPVARFESELLRALFTQGSAAGQQTTLSAAKAKFDAAVPTIRQYLYDELVQRGYFPRSPEATRKNWKTAGVVAVTIAVIAGCIGASLIADLAPFVWIPVLVAVLLGAALMLLSNAMPQKSTVGAETAARWRAFRKYLEDIEKYEKLDEARGIFDRYLPYAVAFGVEDSWVQKFASVRTPTPSWYGATGSTGGGSLADVLTSNAYGRRRRGFGGGTVILPGGGWGNEWGGGQSSQGGGGGVDFPGMPDLQDTSDDAGRSLQSSSDGFMTMLNLAGRAFSGFAGSGRHGGGGGWGGGGGGFGGGGSSGGSSGGGGGGFH